MDPYTWPCQYWPTSKKELINDVLLWTPTHGRASIGRPGRTYLHQLCADTGCSLKDLLEAMDDRDRRRNMIMISPIFGADHSSVGYFSLREITPDSNSKKSSSVAINRFSFNKRTRWLCLHFLVKFKCDLCTIFQHGYRVH